MSLMEPLAIRLGGQTTPAKSLVMPRYSEYKDSGACLPSSGSSRDRQMEWLGEVPVHWEVKRLKHNLKLLTEKTDRREHPVALENIESWSGRFIETETKFEGDGVAFNQGDILFGKLRPYLAKAYLATTAGEAVGDFHVMRPSVDVDGRFAQYQILNRDFIAIVDGSTFGAKMPRASWDFMCNMALTTPPKPEQQIIAAFLDLETEKIDALIAEQRWLVELLAEKRQAVISHAVTKGLNPHAKMKDSGTCLPSSGSSCDGQVEWLGEVPEHWAVVPLGHLAKQIQTGPFGSQLHSEEYVDGETPVINPSNIQDGKLIADWSCTVTQEIVDRLSHHKLLCGDIVFGRRGEMGRCALVTANEVNWLCGTGSLNVRLSSRAIPEFVSIYLRTSYVRELLKLESVGSTMDNLNTQILSSVPVPQPPLDEQQIIVDFLDTEIAKFDALTLEANRAIELLQERRSALISAAVTGKIDVRCNTFESGAQDAVTSLS